MRSSGPSGTPPTSLGARVTTPSTRTSTSRRTRSRRRATAVALAAGAALLVAGLGAAPVGAAPPGPPGAAPAALSPGAYLDLVRAADAPEAKRATARELGLGAKEALEVRSVVKNNNGDVHVRYERTYAGLPVIGGDLVVHRKKDGTTKRVTRATDAGIAVNTDAPAAHRPARAAAKGSTEPRKVVWAGGEQPVLAWQRVVGGTQPDGTPNRLHQLTDARTGETLLEYQGVHKGTGHSMYSGEVKLGTTADKGRRYSLVDAARGGARTHDMNNGQSGQGTLLTSRRDVWGDGTPGNRETAAVDAHHGAAVTWDYFRDVHGRQGIRGDGEAALTRVHYGNNYSNAFWSDGCFCMTYGDGAGNAKPLTSVDVAAHEMVHGLTSATAGLIYAGESGGLNEATSDIFAAAVEFHVDSPVDRADYHVGELIDIRGDGKPLRYMDQPSRDGRSLDYWRPGAGNVGVHYSSGIGNHFFYLLAEGSGKKEINGVSYDSPTYDGSELAGIGIDKAAAIWFKALTEQMTSTTDYQDARRATVTAAGDLYGADSAEVRAVAAAWTAVNVTG
ncbi:M4 family metallopeptidase [Streptomyces sp. OF8]|uniref:Neutral metalloproteinase n=1 Tax=Streptomyces alkaliterrae TaxID=2213162 RepID=A0A5P0YTK3_9ACTN|nr:M4 family metallopeptidase [Streptomyces alkaliterrae]MQS02967.1 peptidase M4 family protein [Streptomyces alkaliterrae]